MSISNIDYSRNVNIIPIDMYSIQIVIPNTKCTYMSTYGSARCVRKIEDDRDYYSEYIGDIPINMFV